MHRPCRGFRRGIDGGGGGGGGGCCPCGGGGSGVAAGKCRELAPSPPPPRFWTIHRDVREDVEKFLRINCLVLRSNSLSKGTANLVKHRERREKSNLIHGLRMEDGDFLF